jgi:hypothetical protein
MPDPPGYQAISRAIAALLEAARRQAARAVNAILTAAYGEVRRQVMAFEQKGKRLAQDLTARFGQRFSWPGLRPKSFRRGLKNPSLSDASALFPRGLETGRRLQTSPAGRIRKGSKGESEEG